MIIKRDLVEAFKQKIFNYVTEDLGFTSLAKKIESHSFGGGNNYRFGENINDQSSRMLETGGSQQARHNRALRNQMYQSQERRLERAEEIKAKREERNQLATQLRQTMSNVAAENPELANDQTALRTTAINRLAKDEEFTRRANELGYTVGRHTGGINTGSGPFGYRYSTGAEKEKAEQEAWDRLKRDNPTANLAATRQEQEKINARNASKWSSAAREEEARAASIAASRESVATEYGRLAQRMGSSAIRPPRSQDEADRLAGARQDVERARAEAAAQGRKLGYEDEATLRAGFQRRGYEFGAPLTPAQVETRDRYAAAKAERDRVVAEVEESRRKRREAEERQRQTRTP